MAVTIFVERKKSEQTFFQKIHSALTIAPTENLHEYKIVERKMAHLQKIHSALTIAPTENLHEYKIVERKMAHLFYMGKFYLALLV